jgi:ABC-2 type transport system ATP-binding protein
MKAVTVENLTKIYAGGKKAVDGIGFSLEQGEVFGFLGPNGAGKTTVVKLLNGMLAPTQGKCSVFGIDPYQNPVAVHQFSGVVTEHAQMYGDMSGLQNLIFYGKTFGLNITESKNRGIELLEQLGLTDAKDRKLDTYSTGMRQRLSLARAMMHRPKILFLDEPTSGLDPESVQSVNNMIKSLAENEGATIFLCTHQLRYAQEICSTYGLIDHGVILASGNLEKLRAMIFSGLTVSIKTDRLPDDFIEAGKTGSLRTTRDDELMNNDSLTNNGSLINNDRFMDYETKVASPAEIPHLVRRIVEAGGNIYQVTTHRLSLEDIYFALLEKRSRA